MTSTKSKNVNDINTLTSQLAHLYYEVQQNKDGETAAKIAELINKTSNNELTIAFCGHFSAGKSSMINHLLGEFLLPSSPIPTSANLVKIKSGEASIRLHFQDGAPMDIPYPDDMNDIKNYFIDGKTVQSVDITSPSACLPEGVAVLDTPGIDSTDDAHRLATESALHMADVIVYVTDYNHVQSEMNANFLQRLGEQNKRIDLIVNQVDKHSEAELDFTVYRSRIEASFTDYGIHSEHIFYTSLLAPEHPENQISLLQQRLQNVFAEKDALLINNVQNSAQQLIAEHIDALKQRYADQRHDDEQIIADLSQEELETLQTTIEHKQTVLRDLQAQPDQLKTSIKSKLNKTIGNAILLPYETRELARQYLESRQPGFKMGLIFSKNKTETERQRRLQVFYENLSEKVGALDRTVKQLLVDEAKRFGIDDESFFRSIYDTHVPFESAMLADEVQEGATVSGDYILKYRDKIIELIKDLYKSHALTRFDEAGERLKHNVRIEATQLEQEIKIAQKQYEAFDDLHNLDAMMSHSEAKLRDIMDGRAQSIDEDTQSDLINTLTTQPVATSGQISDVQQRHTSGSLPNQQVVEWETNHEGDQPIETDFKGQLQDAASRLNKAGKAIASIKGLQNTAQLMYDRAQRYEHRQLTVSLFGAFSAGKSSFANALLGDKVLPVSPNPTTATINQIMPVDAQHPHGTVIITFKTEEQMTADINQALTPFNATINNLHELLTVAQGLNRTNLSADAKAQATFLDAVTSGLDQMEPFLSQDITVDLYEFSEYVADELKACFVEKAILYYDCPLTQEGITLVDTPGADSVNARHTGVAFEYIKNADAILFVTYYNHAFTQADREFLIQLGRVKDTFAMDKMFFIVNAADLASSKEEVNDVVGYVSSNLVSYGIRQPRLFPVSSQLALTGKQQEYEDTLEQSGLPQFEAAFHRFTANELTNMAVDAADGDIKRALDTVHQFIETANADEQVREEQRQANTAACETITTKINQVDTTPNEQAINQKLDTLLYHVKQRVFLRFGDDFKGTFNPSALNDNDVKSEALRHCMEELIQVVGFNLTQELRATSLRMEKAVTNQTDNLFANMDKIVTAHSQSSISQPEDASIPTPHFEEGLQGVNVDQFKSSLKLFKNPKQFFEQNGKETMREALLEQFRPLVSSDLETAKTQLHEQYVNAFVDQAKATRDQAILQINEYFDGLQASLSLDIDTDTLNQARNQLQRLL